MTNNEVLRADCRYCGKKVFSLYKNQLTYNLKAHELSCVLHKKNETIKRELNTDDKTSVDVSSNKHKEVEQNGNNGNEII